MKDKIEDAIDKIEDAIDLDRLPGNTCIQCLTLFFCPTLRFFICDQ